MLKVDLMHLRWLLAGLLACSAPVSADDDLAASVETSQITQRDIFERFQQLSGSYVENPAAGQEDNVAEVEYALWSRDSAVVESWTMPTKREMTVFHMDNEQLVATHYCGAGIQVTMHLEWPMQDDELIFKARYVSNHSNPDAAFNSGFGYRFMPNGDIVRSEVWTTAGEDSHSSITLERQVDLDG